MKTKEYVHKYHLNVSDKFNHNDFIGNLTIDFMTLLEIGYSSNESNNKIILKDWIKNNL